MQWREIWHSVQSLRCPEQYVIITQPPYTNLAQKNIMEYKHISKTVHVHTCNLTDILIDNEHKICLTNENSVTSSSLNKGGVWSPRLVAKMVVSWSTMITIDDKNDP